MSIDIKSLSLAQSIQSHVTNTYNQTTLGLAVKLYHGFGSRKIIDVLHESGFITTYDEVLRFKTSAAIYTGNMPHKLRGLKSNSSPICAWNDNFDLNISTPNGCRQTHSLVIEFTQQIENNSINDQREYQSPVIP